MTAGVLSAHTFRRMLKFFSCCNFSLQSWIGLSPRSFTVPGCVIVSNRRRTLLLAGWFALGFGAGFPNAGWSQTTTLNVLDFGARGDAVQTFASTVSNSTIVTLAPTNSLSSADVGKVIELFGVGTATTNSNYQDLVAVILSVTNATNITISVPAGLSSNAVACTIGTQNAQAFQQCVDACAGTNTDVLVPPGRYLLIPPSVLVPGFSMNSASVITLAVNLRTGGIRFLGTDPANTILLGNGAWTLKGPYVQRGALFGCIGPILNNFPLVFQNLTMDGGVQVGNQGNIAGPASVIDGSGWDITHAAVVDEGSAPLHALKRFVNCRVTHWRGEMLKSVTAGKDGLIQVTNCAFVDGDGSGFNFNFTHQISGCLFSNLFMAMEFYEGYMQGNSVFENSTITNVVNAIVLVGALTNRVQPSYTISGNTIAPSKFGILFSPVQNLVVTGNQFLGGQIGVGSDNYAYQGTTINSNIVVQNNTFTGTGYCLNIASSGPDQVVNMMWQSNTALNCGRFANGYGWSSNVTFVGNHSLPLNSQQGLLWGAQLGGQYFIDDESNQFPTNVTYGNLNSLTNTLTYALGMRQCLVAECPNCVAILDTSHPQQVPPGAVLDITFTSQYPGLLCLSSQGRPEIRWCSIRANL